MKRYAYVWLTGCSSSLDRRPLDCPCRFSDIGRTFKTLTLL
jgi:hypothetical protein